MVNNCCGCNDGISCGSFAANDTLAYMLLVVFIFSGSFQGNFWQGYNNVFRCSAFSNNYCDNTNAFSNSFINNFQNNFNNNFNSKFPN